MKFRRTPKRCEPDLRAAAIKTNNMKSENTTDTQRDQASNPRLVRFLDKMERDVRKDWEEIFNRYPIATRTDEESDIVGAEQLSINGYLQAIDEIRDFIKANVNVDSGLKALEVPRLVVPSGSPDQTGSSASPNPVRRKGMIPFSFSKEEKEEVINYMRSLGPQYQNSTVVLDSEDLPQDLIDQLSFADRDEDEIHNSSRQLLSQIRRHKEILNRNKEDHSNS